MVTHSALFHEIREKIALAFETGFLIFLTDEQLENYTNEIYPDIDKLRNLYPGIPFNITLINPAPQVIFVGVQTDTTLYKIREQIVMFADAITHRLISEYLAKHPYLNPEDLMVEASTTKTGIKFKVKRAKL